MSPGASGTALPDPGRAEQDQLQKTKERKSRKPTTYPQRRSYTQRINDGSIFGEHGGSNFSALQHLDERMTQNLVMQALFRAVAARRPARGLVHHSDRGSQYCAHAYQQLLRQFGMQTSMSRKGNCWDNAPMESCWGSLKNELIYHRRFATRGEAKREITEYIEIFYNRIRKQARLGYLSPAAFMQLHYEKQIAA